VEHRKADVRQVTGFGASGDDESQFLRELRQLRDGAGLGHAELAARAHFPYDSIRAAEVGPALPDLPVLSAYVRGCGGTTEEWEERWRSLTRSPSLPVSASRQSGRSDAATAGARIGSVSQVGDSPDPSIIIAALNRVAEEMASPNDDPAAPSPDVPLADELMLPDDLTMSDDLTLGDDLTRADDLTLGDDLTLAEDSFPSVDEALTSAPEPVTSDKPTGWDPIRVSTAWPAIRDTPTVADEPVADTWSARGTGTATTWGTAPWEADHAGTDSSAASAVGSAAQAAGGASKALRSQVAAAGPARAVGVASGSGHASSRTRVVVLAAVLLCVLAVLLAVFA
jgi:Helix-turn-helix domain